MKKATNKEDMMKAIFVRKASSLEVVKDVIEELKEKGYEGANYQVTREVELCNEDFRKLANDLLEDQAFIQKDEGGLNDEGEVLCIRVINKESGERILIDPQGYEYPRYTAIEEKNHETKM